MFLNTGELILQQFAGVDWALDFCGLILSHLLLSNTVSSPYKVMLCWWSVVLKTIRVSPVDNRPSTN